MSTTTPPPWLKAMENGAIGEARAKAFLLDRFWVLERSVDIDGADFIIQRRLTGRNILDKRAPRLGVVQVKFYGTPKTTHYVHKDYVVGGDGKPRAEFFLLCFSGNEENPMAYILTAQDVSESFHLVESDGNYKYRIPHSAIASTLKHKISSNKRVLDRMEAALEQADFDQNRSFLSWALPSARGAFDSILPLYKEPINNWWGDIPVGFRDLKKRAYEAAIAVEEIHEKLIQLAEEKDPLQAERIVDDIAFECRDGLGNWSVSLPRDLYDEDFFNACRIHRQMVDTLRSDGLLDQFIEFKNTLKCKFLEFIADKLPIDKNEVCVIDICYSLPSFHVRDIKLRMESVSDYFNIKADLNEFGHVEVPKNEYAKVVSIDAESISLYIVAGRYGLRDVEKIGLYEAYRRAEFSLYTDCMDGLYALKYGDPYGQ
ncbi:hypothetical protein [Methylotuvimicrobium sp. KM1]|uniref:hypothetical protein n=1 Tax=Methylotuvimicrobium sp. KM1 TaxID=3377707 RepID=UPI00384D86B1